MTDPALDGAGEPSLSQSDLTTIGARLAAARESLGLSVADVARQIKLSVPQVMALEADDLSRLPKSPVIVKGFLRNYAKLVQLDPDKLLGSLHAAPGVGDEVKGRYRRREVITFERPSRPWLRIVLGMLLLVAILLGAYEYHMNPDLFGEPAAPQMVDRSPMAPRPAPSQIAARQSPQGQQEPATAQTATATIEGQGMAAGPAAATPEQPVSGNLPPTAAAASGAGIVRFRFERDAWIEIKDRDGNRIMNQLGKAGTEKSVQGIPPLQLVVGAASGVKVEWNDQPVNIVPFTKVDVARFTLE
jgi:cytoskeleton protein RodZ